MPRNKTLLPIMLGMNPKTKQGIGIKSKLGSGYDLRNGPTISVRSRKRRKKMQRLEKILKEIDARIEKYMEDPAERKEVKAWNRRVDGE